MLLLPMLEKPAPSCVVNVSSIAHRVPFKELNLETISDPSKYNKYVHYGKSKICNLLLIREWNKRLENKGVNSVCENYIL